jgi:hypothetical protein
MGANKLLSRQHGAQSGSRKSIETYILTQQLRRIHSENE